MRGEIRPDSGSPWQALGAVWPNSDFDPIRALRASEGSYFSRPAIAEPCCGRNYVLFAALSDIRNGVGFAGVDTGDRIEPSVAAGRGLPEDLAFHFANPTVDIGPALHSSLSAHEQAAEAWIFGEHSFGWLTLRELLDYDWDRVIVRRGVISRDEYERRRQDDYGGEPKSYCGSVGGRGIKVVDRADPFSERNPLPASATHARVRWVSRLRDEVAEFMAVVEKMRHWGDNFDLWHSTGGRGSPKSTMHDPDCIRLVFGYDS